jgi:hypothetical protein
MSDVDGLAEDLTTDEFLRTYESKDLGPFDFGAGIRDELEVGERPRTQRSRPSDPLGPAVACRVGRKRDRSAISGSKRKSTPGAQGRDGVLRASRLFTCPIWGQRWGA